MSEAQQRTLETRLRSIAGNAAIRVHAATELTGGGSEYPVTAALRHASALLNQAISGYAMLQTIALRFHDSSLIGEGNTGDIAEKHTKNYVGSVHEINRVLHNVVLWELDREGAICQCSCPSCALGVGLCAQAPRLTLSKTWSEFGPISDESAVFVHSPRLGSAAAHAGLRHGDIIVAADGQELESHFTLQGVIGGHQPGESIKLRIRRGSGELEEIKVVRP